jgi:aryl-alcohol dehydrogenase-like predicted oxidoreductase
MTNATSTSQPAAASGTFAIGGDLPVARLGFGTMRLPTGTLAGLVRDPQDGIAVLRRAVELGVNHIDTTSFYRRGHVAANELIRRALAPYPDGLVIATKVGPMLGPDGTPALQATPGQLCALVEDNLRELGAGHLDLVYLRVGGRNAPGGEPVAERFAALAKLRADGLIRHLRVSNVDAAQLAEARAIAPVRLHGMAEFRRDEPIATYRGEVPSLLLEALGLAEQHGLGRGELASELCWSTRHLSDVLSEVDSRPELHIVR